jgi:GPH family glycoside/pentoside/hexuronide:cation symporter
MQYQGLERDCHDYLCGGRSRVIDSVPSTSARYGTRVMLIYALPTIAAGTVMAPITAILPSLYAKYTQVSLAALGTLFVIVRLVDAVSDPLVGYWSDRTRSARFGRKPWVIAGALVTSVSVWFLFRIPPAAGIVYLTCWSILFYMGYTAHEVPHMAWGSEITPDYVKRAKLFSFRSMADTSGGFIYTLLPPILFYLGLAHSTDYTPQVFHRLGYGVLILFPLMITLAARYAPAGEVGTPAQGSLHGLLKDTFRNRPQLRFLAAYIVAGAGTGIFAALFFPYFDSYLHIGDKVAYLLLTAMIAQFVSQPFWAKVVSLIGKHRCWAYGWIANSAALVPMALIKPGPSAVWPVMICVAVYSFTNGVSSVAPMALLADVADYEMLKHGVDRTANYYAFMLFLAKVTASIGGLVFVFLGAVFGYSIADGAVNTAYANRGMLIAFCVLPSAFQMLAIPFIWNFPIDRRRHDIIRRRLERREALQVQRAA